MMSSVTGPVTRSNSRTPPSPFVRVNWPTTLALKIIGAGGVRSISAPIRNLALFKPWKSCWPVRGPEESLVLLWTLGPATFQASRWAWVSTRLHAGAKLANPRRMCRCAGDLGFAGRQYRLWQFPKRDLYATTWPILPLLGMDKTFI